MPGGPLLVPRIGGRVKHITQTVDIVRPAFVKKILCSTQCIHDTPDWCVRRPAGRGLNRGVAVQVGLNISVNFSTEGAVWSPDTEMNTGIPRLT